MLVVEGGMIGGFVLVAASAEYGVTVDTHSPWAAMTGLYTRKTFGAKPSMNSRISEYAGIHAAG
jgi:hypothetical protein